MKEIYEEAESLKGDEQIFKLWEPLKFEIKENYEFIPKNFLFHLLSNILFCIIAPILFIINKVMFGFKIEGTENIKKVKTGKVTVSNHVHPMDCTINALANFPRRTFFPTLETNFKIPLVRHLIRILYAIPIPKETKLKERFFCEINKLLKENKTVHMYPEGALWPYYEKIRNFKSGAFHFAVQNNVPIVPMVYVFEEPKGIYKIYKKKKCIHLKILEPIYPDVKLDKKEQVEKLKEEVQNIMMDETKSLRIKTGMIK